MRKKIIGILIIAMIGLVIGCDSTNQTGRLCGPRIDPEILDCRAQIKLLEEANDSLRFICAEAEWQLFWLGAQRSLLYCKIAAYEKRFGPLTGVECDMGSPDWIENDRPNHR